MATLDITPNPAAPEANYTLSGCGYDMRPVEVWIDGNFAYAIGIVSAGGNCLDNNYFPAPEEPGSYEIELLQQKEHGKKKEVKAAATLTVE